MTRRLEKTILTGLLLCGFAMFCPAAHAWGCEGHEIVALLAENHLGAHAKETVLRILAASPIDPTLSRYCRATGDLVADSSTWADDERKVRPETAPWHFIDIPRGARQADVEKYCPANTGCVTSELADELRILRDLNATAQARADALRFLIHFVGDIHQPLHAITNNDLGGNCVPVEFFGRAPVERTGKTASYHPNLHQVWDTDMIERLFGNENAQQVAMELDAKFSHQFSQWQSSSPNFNSWAWESHELAERIAYGKLPEPIPIATPETESSCADPGVPVVNPPEKIEQPYQDVAAPVVEEQLARAGARLAGLLNSLWP